MAGEEPLARHERVRVLVDGRVQGVGFRDGCQRRAAGLGLAGWVRNRPDGAVEAEFEGPGEAVRTMLGWCRTGPRMARVDQVETQTLAPTGEAGFRVR